ncbi:probable protein disulfide-isomerase A4 [Agrilus planipennis]|uniref:Probable protein disulfide-isomerase A4 n=1 Tax=Agrilus planipennis TaxID=224129 RepID=A0A1W4WG67_AGRPL|nr:probable protein disulfide-isomerase A4 [Agrilus planipennis]
MKFLQNMGLFLVSVVIISLLSISFSENVLELSENNFERTLDNFKYVMVKFYSPECTNCKALNPVYQEIARKINDIDLASPVKLAEVDATHELSLTQKFKVASYPSLLLFEKGSLKGEYKGTMDPSEILNWLLKQTQILFVIFCHCIIKISVFLYKNYFFFLMMRRNNLLLFFVSLLAVFIGVIICDDTSILELDRDSFQATLRENKFVLVNFYAPWCKYCRDFNPTYQATARKLEELGSSIRLAKVDATIERPLANQYNIKGYPTLVFFKNGVPSDQYGGIRTQKGIVTWLLKKADPYSKE